MTTTLLPRPDWLARLRSIMVLRPGQRVAHVPGIGVRASRRAVSSGAVDWWEAGGASGAVAVYQPIGAASLAASYVNLANPGTYDAAPGVAPTWAAVTGWTFNGSTQYLPTGVVPAAGWSALVRFSNATVTGGARVAIGSRANADPRFLIGPSLSGAGTYYGYGGYKEIAPVLASGVLAIAGNRAYRNGVLDDSNIGTWSGTAVAITIGARNWNTTIDSHFAGDIQAVAIYSTTLTAGMVAAVSAAMAAL